MRLVLCQIMVNRRCLPDVCGAGGCAFNHRIYILPKSLSKSWRMAAKFRIGCLTVSLTARWLNTGRFSCRQTVVAGTDSSQKLLDA